MSDLIKTAEWLRQMADSRKNKTKKWQYTNAADEIDRLTTENSRYCDEINRLKKGLYVMEGLLDGVLYPDSSRQTDE